MEAFNFTSESLHILMIPDKYRVLWSDDFDHRVLAIKEWKLEEVKKDDSYLVKIRLNFSEPL